MKRIGIVAIIVLTRLVITKSQELNKKDTIRNISLNLGSSIYTLKNQSISSFTYSGTGISALVDYSFSNNRKYYNNVNVFINQTSLVHKFTTNTFNPDSKINYLNARLSYTHFRSLLDKSNKTKLFLGGMVTTYLNYFNSINIDGKGIIVEGDRSYLNLLASLDIALKFKRCIGKGFCLDYELSYPLLAIKSGIPGEHWQPYHEVTKDEKRVNFMGPEFVSIRSKIGVNKKISNKIGVGMSYCFYYNDYKSPHRFQKAIHNVFLNLILKL